MDIDYNLLIGTWQSDDIDYIFEQNFSLTIIWKKKNVKSRGFFKLSANTISFQYGISQKLSWSGKIQKINCTNLEIVDVSNEIGKVDFFIKKKNPTALKTNTYNLIVNNTEQYPFCLLPDNLLNLFQKTHFVKPEKPILPIQRIEETNNLSKLILMIIGIIILFVSLSNEIISIALFGSLLFFSSFLWFIINPEGKKHDKATAEWLVKFKEYEKSKTRYNESQTVSQEKYNLLIKKEKFISTFSNLSDFSLGYPDYKKAMLTIIF